MAKGTFAECPKCGARVRKDRLRRHLNSVHGDRERTKAPKGERRVPRTSVAFPWKVVGALAVVAAVALTAYWFATRPPGGGSSVTKPIAIIETNYGTIRIELDTERAPRTAGNFVALARGGRYDGTSIHRVAANFVIQGGAITGAANVAWEDTGLRNLRYTIAMARSGSADDAASKDSATSQFFINLRDNPSLDAYAYPYVVFGRVLEGQSVVDTIGSLYPPGQTNYDGPPTSPVTIVRVTMTG